MNVKKMDAALNAALSGAAPGSRAGKKFYEVTVRVASPLSEVEAGELTALGVRADTRRTIFTSRLGPDALRDLTERPCVARVSLSQKLRPLAAR